MNSKITGIVWFCLALGLFINSASIAGECKKECSLECSATQATKCVRDKIAFVREEIDYLQDKYPAQNKTWDKKWAKYQQETNALIKSSEAELAKLAGSDEATAKKLLAIKKKLDAQHKQLPLPYPSGPAGPGRFGAYYTKLKYSLSWDKPWRVSQHPDVVVRFDDAAYKFVFWRGTIYIPCWVTENDIWFTNEFAETIDAKTRGSQEPLSDRYCRHSNVRIVENTDARVVVHWRYALVDYGYKLAHQDPVTGWHDWADEYYYIYPNGIAMRKIIIHSSRLDMWHEFQESIILNPPGTTPEEKINADALTVANLKGESKTFTWTKNGAPGWREQPKGSCIQWINLKSKQKPFSIAPPEKTMIAVMGGNQGNTYFNTWCGPVRPHTVDNIDPSPAYHFKQPTHSCLAWYIKELKPDEAMYNFATVGWLPYEETETSQTKLLLTGLTEKSASELAVLGRSWLRAPKLDIIGKDFVSQGYDQRQLAFVMARKEKPKSSGVTFAILASKDSPIVNPAFVIEDWGEADVRLKIKGREIKQGKKFRVGHRRSLQGTDLIVWLELESTQPTDMEFVPVKY